MEKIITKEALTYVYDNLSEDQYIFLSFLLSGDQEELKKAIKNNPEIVDLFKRNSYDIYKARNVVNHIGFSKIATIITDMYTREEIHFIGDLYKHIKILKEISDKYNETNVSCIYRDLYNNLNIGAHLYDDIVDVVNSALEEIEDEISIACVKYTLEELNIHIQNMKNEVTEIYSVLFKQNMSSRNIANLYRLILDYGLEIMKISSMQDVCSRDLILSIVANLNMAMPSLEKTMELNDIYKSYTYQCLDNKKYEKILARQSF